MKQNCFMTKKGIIKINILPIEYENEIYFC